MKNHENIHLLQMPVRFETGSKTRSLGQSLENNKYEHVRGHIFHPILIENHPNIHLGQVQNRVVRMLAFTPTLT